jgi:hypothetical protein
MMADGYGFCVLIIIILHHQMIFIYQRPKLLFGLKTEILLRVCPPKEGEKFFPLVKVLK